MLSATKYHYVFYYFKIYMGNDKRNRALTDHHIIPRSRGGSNDKINIKRIQWGPHDGLHRYFGNKLPHEQIIQVLEDSSTAMTSDTIRAVKEVINDYLLSELVYKDGVWR